jgi:hypothetical protein
MDCPARRIRWRAVPVTGRPSSSPLDRDTDPDARSVPWLPSLKATALRQAARGHGRIGSQTRTSCSDAINGASPSVGRGADDVMARSVAATSALPRICAAVIEPGPAREDLARRG